MCSSSSNYNSKLKKYFFFISFYSVTTNNNSLELYSIITWSGCFKFRLQKTCCGAVAPLVRFFLCVCFALFVCLGVVVTKNQRALFFPSQLYLLPPPYSLVHVTCLFMGILHFFLFIIFIINHLLPAS